MTNLKIFFLSIMLSSVAISQTSKFISRANRDVKKMDRHFLKSIPDTVEINDLSSEGGFLLYFQDSLAQVSILKLLLFGETGKSIEKFYFSRDTIFAVMSQVYSYNVPFNVDSNVALSLGSEAFVERKTKIENEEFYFIGNKLEHWIGKNGKTETNSNSIEKEEQQLLNLISDLRQRMGTKK